MEDENEDRGNWDSKTDYLLSCIGYAVGLGNVWRFPYLAFKNGGGAFLIPYMIMLLVAGLPIFFMEVALGQFSSLGPTSVWKFSPVLKGVGVCMVCLSFLVGIYYNVIIAYTVFYLFSSLTNNLPWESCGNFWNNQTTCSTEFKQHCEYVNLNNYREQLRSPAVRNLLNAEESTFTGIANSPNFFSNVSKTELEELKGILNGGENFFQSINCSTFLADRGTSPTEEYWRTYALHLAPRIDPQYTGFPNIHLVLSLIVAWLVVYYSLIRGIKSSGKVVYFTALFPYVVLFILLIRGATLEGAYDGVQYYIGSKSQFEKLTDANVWKDAATQIFFSLSASWGGLIALSSYNKFSNNCFQDALIVCFVNCATSLFAGFAIFTVLGHMAFKLGSTVDKVVQSSFGLAFIVFPEAIAQLPISSFWAILFFLMLFSLGLDSQFTILETVSTAIIDSYPRQLRSRRWQLMLFLSVGMFLLGLVCVTDTGNYWVDLMDHYAAGWGLLFVAVMEVAGVSYIYGGNRFIQDVEMMIGKRSNYFWFYWRACWFVITPVVLTVILFGSLATFKGKTYPDEVSYPAFANALGWLMIVFAIMFIPIFAISAILKKKSILQAARANPDWGPYLKQHRGERYANMEEPQEALEIAKERALLRDFKSGGINPGYSENEN